MAVLNYSTNFQRAKYCDNTAELHIGNMANLVLTEVGVIRKMTERHHTCSSGGNLHFHMFAICMNIPISFSAV